MIPCLFASDLHGRRDRYEKLFATIGVEAPAAVFLGGDLMPPWFWAAQQVPEGGFDESDLTTAFQRLRSVLGPRYPRVFLILGNDDRLADEAWVLEGSANGLWEYVHRRRAAFDAFAVYGYNCVPPTPFQLKDWERYDVSRYLDPGCVSPEEGWHSAAAPEAELRFATIEKEVVSLLGRDPMERAILLLHSPPYHTALDRAALDGKMVDHVPLDVHVGSIAIRRIIEARQPLLTLHGHVHESARLSGSWRQCIGRTFSFSAAHDGPELAVVRFDADDPEGATRELI